MIILAPRIFGITIQLTIAFYVCYKLNHEGGRHIRNVLVLRAELWFPVWFSAPAEMNYPDHTFAKSFHWLLF